MITDNISTTFNVLEHVGLSKYFEEQKNDKSNAKQRTIRVSKILNWTYRMKNITALQSEYVITWFELLLEKNYLSFKEFASYLSEPPNNAKPGTVVTYFDNISSAITWLTFFSRNDGDDNIRRLTEDQIGGAKEIINMIRKNFRGRIMKGTKTMSRLIKERKLPEGGLETMQKIVMDSAKEVFSIDWSIHANNKTTYQWFMQVLISAMYCLNVQGRIGGVMHLALEDGNSLIASGRAMSLLFKTQSTYIAQPVTATEVSRGLMELYLRFLRPWALSQSTISYSVVKEKNGEFVDRLFLNSSGKPEANGGRELSKFFRKFNLNISTNIIRSLFETLTNRKHKLGELSDAQREASRNVNGHSGRISKDFYLLDQREDDAAVVEDIANTVFKCVDTSYTSATPLIGRAPAPCALLHGADAWGFARQDFNVDNLKKAEWTLEEKTFIGDFCLEELRQYKELPAKLAIAEHSLISTCLSYIRLVVCYRFKVVYHKYHIH
jgi:hypothetical protein